ncbi:MAG: A/G-specific adenine glycosylase [Phycisphaeraceae bacterium]|nr:MAG: A/G-specific adenine glycosylase [Phycisphaeraceae bacterium]
MAADEAKMNDRTLARTLTAWARSAARALPWRDAEPGRRDPYRVLVSELMLQQTQVSRVAERFAAFIGRFPDVRALAQADEADVLAAWSGLGYYRRARHLHAAAKAIVERHGGAMPRDPAALLALPGVGRYTAGAVASIAFDQPQPIVDGNVARVLLRLHGRSDPPTAPATIAWSWARATDLVHSAKQPGSFNEAMMELGAIVCTPRSPACDSCPIARECEAKRRGLQDEIPAPKPRAKQSPLFVGSVLAVDTRGRRLVERRPATGLWAGLWQPPSLERDDRPPEPRDLAEALGLSIRGNQPAERFTHQTTHRRVEFGVWHADHARAGAGRVWRSRLQLESLALGSPQRRILLGG